MVANPSLLHRPVLWPVGIPEAFWINRADVERSLVTDTEDPPGLLRHSDGSPQERFDAPAPLAALSQLRCAVVDVGPEERTDWMQAGQDLSHKAYFPRYLAGELAGFLPDIRKGDRLKLPDRPNGEARRFAVLSTDDVEQAGLLLEVRCREVLPGDIRQHQA